MSRFEIEDIVSQDKRGIVFRAHDTERGHTVALRRFFPFGQDGGGLSDEEAEAFRKAAQALEGLRHGALRSVISGSVDPIDGMPYVVAEWIDGEVLETVLGGEKLEPAVLIELLRQAIEVSISLSGILGEEAVWVETEPESIFVGSGESCRGFVFWLSPFKWLGAEFTTRKLSAIADLGERLAGWKGKLIGDHAGNGLGAWLKWVRNNPDAGLAEGLQALDECVTPGEADPPDGFAAIMATQPAVSIKPTSSLSPLVIAAVAVLLLAVAGLAVYHKMAKAPTIPPQYAEQKISEPLSDSKIPANVVPAPDSVPPTSEAKPPEQNPDPVASTPDNAVASTPDEPPAPPAAAADPTPAPAPKPDSEAIALAKAQELARKLAEEKEIERTAALAPAKAVAPPPRDLTPADGELMKDLKANGPASVTGVLRNVRLSAPGNSLYFEFSKPTDKTEISAVAHKRSYDGGFSPSDYADLVGKKVRFDGVVFREPGGRQYVKISAQKRMKVQN